MLKSGLQNVSYQKYRIQFLTSASPYLKAEKSCVDFLTRRTESNLNTLREQENEKSQLENSGMATVVPRAYNELKTKVEKLELDISEDRNIIKKLMSDASRVFNAVKGIVTNVSDLTPEERSSMHALAALFRDLDIGNDFRPPPLSGSDKVSVEENEIDRILSSSPDVSRTTSKSSSSSSPPARQTQSFAQAKPKRKKVTETVRISSPPLPSSSRKPENTKKVNASLPQKKTQTKVKFSWASKSKTTSKKKPGKTLMELMEEEKEKRETTLITNRGNRDVDRVSA